MKTRDEFPSWVDLVTKIWLKVDFSKSQYSALIVKGKKSLKWLPFLEALILFGLKQLIIHCAHLKYLVFSVTLEVPASD